MTLAKGGEEDTLRYFAILFSINLATDAPHADVFFRGIILIILFGIEF